MIFLFLFGPLVEDRLGKLFFILMYISGSAISALVFLITVGPKGGHVPLVGASGAIATVIGAFFVLAPFGDIKHYAIFLGYSRGGFMGTIKIPAFIYVPIFVLQNYFYAKLQESMQEMIGIEGGGVAYWAHLGGVFWGYLILLPFYGFTGWTADKSYIWFKKGR